MSVYKRSDVWYVSACYKRRRVRLATDAHSKAEARHYEAVALMQLHAGVMPKDVVLDNNTAARRQQWTLRDCFERCLREAWSHLKSVDSYHRPVGRSMLNQLGWDVPLRELNAENLITLRKRVLSGQIKPATFNRYMQILNTMFSRSIEWKKPVPDLKPLRFRLEEDERFRILSDEEEPIMLRGAELVSSEYHDFVVCSLDIGWRSSEGNRLRPKDVMLGKREVILWDGKSGSRAVPITERAAQALSRQLRRSMQEGRQVLWGWSKDRCVKLWADAKERAKVDDPDLTAHCLRHTTATRLLERGWDIHVVAQWLGHSNIKTTQKYAKVLGHTLNAARDSLEG